MQVDVRTARNSLFHLAGSFLPLFIFLIIAPYFKNKLGVELFGVLLLITILINVGNVIDFGFGKAIVKFVSEYNSVENKRELEYIINLSLTIFASVGLMVFLFLFSFSDFIVTRLLKISPEWQSYVIITFKISGIAFFFNMIASALGSIPYALHRYDITNTINVGINVIYVAVAYIILALGIKLNGLVVLNITMGVLIVCIYLILIRKLLPQVRIGHYSFFTDLIKKIKTLKNKTKAKNPQTVRFVGFCAFSFIHKIFLIATYNIDKLVIGSCLGTWMVPFYAVPLQVISSLIRPLGRMIEVIIPVASELSAKGDWEKLRRGYLRAVRLTCMLSTSLFLPLILFSNEIMIYWMGESFAAKSSHILFIVGFAYYIISFSGVISLITDGVGKPQINTFFAILYTSLILVFIFPLMRKYGLNGVATAMLFSTFYVPGFVFYCNRKILNLDYSRYLKNIYKPIFIAIFIGSLVHFFKMSIDSVLELVVAVSFVIIVYYCLCYIFKVYGREEIRLLIKIWKKQ